MDAVPSKKEQLHKAFLELQSHSAALVDVTVKWKELDDHFNDLEKLFEELEQKGMENEKDKKTAEEKITGNSNNEKDKKSAVEKNTGNSNKTPEKKSAAEKNTGHSNKTSEKKSAGEKSTGNPSKTSEIKSAAEKGTGKVNKTAEKKSAAEKSTGSPNKTSSALKEDVKPRPQLKSLCEKMDGEGLKKFLVDSRSEVTEIRNEIPAALRCAADPAKLVLKTLKGLYPDDNGRMLYTNLSAERHACDLLLDSLPSVLSPDEMSSEAKKDAHKIAAAWKSKLNVHSESRITIVEAHAFLQLLASYGISKEFKDDDLYELLLRIYAHPKAPELCRALQFSHKIPDVVEKLSSNRKQIHAVRFVYAFGLTDKFPPVPLLKAYLEDEKKVSQELAKKGTNPVAAQNNATSNEINSLKTVIKVIEEYKLQSQMSPKDLLNRLNELDKAKAERKRAAEGMKSQTKRARLSSGDGAGAVLPKPSPPIASALSNSSARFPERTPPSVFSPSNSSDLYRPPVASIPSYNLPDLGVNDRGNQGIYRSAPVTSIPSFNLPDQGVYDRGSQGTYRSAPVSSIPSYSLPDQSVYDRGSQDIYRSSYDVGSNPSSVSRSHLYPSDSLQSSSYGVGSFHGVGSFRGSTNYGSYNNGSGVPPTTSYQSSYLH